jgi:hypothetical protein
MSDADKLKAKCKHAESSAQQPLCITDAEFAVRKMHDSFIAAQVRRVVSRQRFTAKYFPPMLFSLLYPICVVTVAFVLPLLRHRALTLCLQLVLSDRVTAMFKAKYGCDPDVSGVETVPKWFVELKKLVGDTMKPFVKVHGPWDM